MEWNSLAQEREMRRASRRQAHGIVSRPERYRKHEPSLKVGFESEVAIYKEGVELENLADLRDAIIAEIPDIGDVELGASQIEFRTPPINLLSRFGPRELIGVYGGNWSKVVEAARKHGAKIIRVGANPFLPALGTPRTNRPKYKLVPDFYNQHRRPDVNTRIGLGREQVDIGDAAVVSLFQSFQVNLEARSLDDAVRKMNQSLALAPYLLALCGNSRYLGGVDTGFQDLRMSAWEMSHDTGMQDLRLLSWEQAFDTRTADELKIGRGLRVGLPERYFRNIQDYLDRANSFPFILYDPAAALKIAIGMTWLDARVKFIDDSAVVELRLLPTQPHFADEYDLALLYIGMLLESQSANKELLPMEMVRQNRLEAMLHGVHGSMWFRNSDGALERLPYWEGMKREIDKGLRYLDQHSLLKFSDSDEFGFCVVASYGSSVFEAPRPVTSGSFFGWIKNFGSPTDRLALKLQSFWDKISHEDMKQALKAIGMLI